MNHNEFYERRDDRAIPEQPTPQSHTGEAIDALAVHRDPSVPSTSASGQPKPERSIAWVRPSELPTLVGATWARRGID